MSAIKKIFLFFTIGLVSYGQVISQEYSQEEIRIKTDSILAEGNLLYKLEKAAWLITDLTLDNPSIRLDFGGYISYVKGDTTVAIILSKSDPDNCIFEINFFQANFKKPIKELFEKRGISDFEKKLITAREKIIDEIIDNEIEVIIPDGFNLNFVIFPIEGGYKLYIMTGTSQENIIPFGNDYIFIVDNDYKIQHWRKFHSRLIPQKTVGPQGEIVTGLTHSHLKSEPFISTTDICIFMLYGSYYGLNNFAVYSPALSIYFIYKLDENTITISKNMDF